jgi:hypothetical protein
MANPNRTPADHIKTINLVEGQHRGNCSSAARAVGIPRPTMQARYEAARSWRQNHGHEPEKPQEIVTIERVKPRVRMQVASPTGGGYKVLAIGDAHDDPHLPKDRFRWFGAHAAAMKADYVVQIGDWATLDSLNSHIPNDTLAAKQKSPFIDDLASLQESLREFDNGLGLWTPKKHTTLGNHERRAWIYEDQNPESAGLLTGPLLAAFEAHGWTTSPYGEFWYLGGVAFVHVPLNTLGKGYGGQKAESGAIANAAVHDIVFGHTHRERKHTEPKLGPFNRVNIVNLGCALPYGHIEKYAEHNLSGWTWGVEELFIRGGHVESVKFISMLELEERYA